jgi:Na+-driven multidrug efflux pump
LRGAGDTKTPAKVIILMNILNLVFSYGLIYGINFRLSSGLLLGFKGFGVTGAAWGIALARAFGAFLLTYFLAKGLNIASPRRFLTYKINPEILKSILNIGIPNSVESTLFNGGKLITQTFIVGLGTVRHRRQLYRVLAA